MVRSRTAAETGGCGAVMQTARAASATPGPAAGGRSHRSVELPAAMFTPTAPLWQVAVRTLAVYVALLVGLRLMGKREMGQMTVFDLVVLLVLSNAVQNAMVGPDTSLTGGLVAAAILLAANRAVALLRLRNPLLRRVIEGSPTVLVAHGEFLPEALRREGLDREEVETALREHGVASVRQVRLAVLEPDGSISVVPEEADVIHLRKHRRFLKRS